MRHPNKLSFLGYKIVVAKNLIQYHKGWKRAVPMSRPFKRRNQFEMMESIYQTTKRCEKDTHTAKNGW